MIPFEIQNILNDESLRNTPEYFLSFAILQMDIENQRLHDEINILRNDLMNKEIRLEQKIDSVKTDMIINNDNTNARIVDLEDQYNEKPDAAFIVLKKIESLKKIILGDQTDMFSIDVTLIENVEKEIKKTRIVKKEQLDELNRIYEKHKK
jgi:hypothetical protein